DENADISLGTVQNELFPAKDLLRRIDARYKSLCRSLLISVASVKLSGTVEPFHLPKFQRRIKLSCIDTVILNRIGISHNLRMLQPRYRTVHLILYILREGTGHSADIHLIRIFSLRFDKYLMPVFICEFYDLVFDRRTIPRSGSLDRAGKQRGSVQTIPV